MAHPPTCGGATRVRNIRARTPPLAAAGAIAVILLLATVVSTWQAFEASRQRSVAQLERDNAQIGWDTARDAQMDAEQAKAQAKMQIPVSIPRFIKSFPPVPSFIS